MTVRSARRPSRIASFPIFSPQGDGNLCRKPLHYPLLRRSFPIFSPQGDGNGYTLTVEDFVEWGRLFLSFPRKGTETGAMGTSPWSAISCVFSYLFPARGRKPELGAYPPSSSMVVFSYLFPARGRKLVYTFRTPTLALQPLLGLFLSFPRKGTETVHLLTAGATLERLSFPIFSPQGDGNKRLYNNLHIIEKKGLFLSFPRKGTETRCWHTSSRAQTSRRLFLSFPRKGTETGVRKHLEWCSK